MSNNFWDNDATTVDSAVEPNTFWDDDSNEPPKIEAKDITIDGKPIPQQANLILPDRPEFNPEKENAKFLSESLEAGGRGALQGGTFGFSDELMALPKRLTSQEAYDQELAQIRQANEAAQEQSPIAYGAGTLAGAVGQGALTAGTGLVGTGAKVAVSPVSSLVAKLGMTGSKAAPTVGRILANTADASLASGLASAGFSEGDKLQALKEGATDPTNLLLAGGLSTLVQGVPPVLRTAKNLAKSTPVGQSTAEAFNIKRTTGQDVIGREATDRALKATQDLSDEINQELVKGLSQQEGDFKRQLLKTANTAVKLQQRTQNQVGARIGQKVNDILTSGNPMQISATVDDILEDVTQQVRTGALQESQVKGLMEDLLALKQVTPAKPIMAQETRVLSQDPQLGMLGGPEQQLLQRTAKISGKDVGLDELERLRTQATKVSPKAASISETTAPGTDELLRREVVAEALEQPAIPRSDVETEEVLKFRKLTQAGMKASDPALAGLHRRAYGKITQEVENMLPEQQRLGYAADRQKYQKLIELEREVAQDNPITRQTEVKPSFVNLLEQSKDIQGTAKTAQMDRVFKLLDEVNPNLSKQLRTRAETSAEGLSEVQRLMTKYFPSAPGPEASRVRPGIERGIEGLQEAYLGKPERAGEELLGAIEKAAPDRATELKRKSIEIGKLRDLARISKQEDPVFATTSLPKAAMATALGTGKSAFIKGGQVAGGIARAIEQAPARALQKIPTQTLQNLASKTGGSLGRLLSNAASSDKVARNAAIFMISQDTNHKKNLQQLLENDPEAQNLNLEE